MYSVTAPLPNAWKTLVSDENRGLALRHVFALQRILTGMTVSIMHVCKFVVL